MTVTIFVPDIPEFATLIDAARQLPNGSVVPPQSGYWRITAPEAIEFERRKLGIGPALWNSALTGGFIGQIEEYGRDIMRIVSSRG